MAATEQRPAQATASDGRSRQETSAGGRLFWAAWAWAATLLLFVVLATLASFYDRFPSDERIAHAIQGIDVPAFGGFVDAVNAFGVSWLYFPLVFLLIAGFVFLRAGWEAVVMLLVLVPVGLNRVVKDWVGRPRPTEDIVDVHGRSSEFSYPSGHTVATTALFLALFFVLPAVVPWRPVRWLLQAGCVLMVAAAGPARVYVGAHWPSDALAGYLLALLCVAPVLIAYRALSRRSEPPSATYPASQPRG